MAQSENKEWLGCLGIVLVGALAYYSWPISPFVFGCGALWFYCQLSKSAIAKASGGFFMAATWGAGVSALVLAAFNIFYRHVESSWLREFELAAIRIRLGLMDLLGADLRSKLGALVLLLAVACVLRSVKPVGWFTRAQGWAGKLLVFFVALTTFTFCTDLPLAQWTERDHRHRLESTRALVTEFRATLRIEFNLVAEFVAATQVRHECDDLESEEIASAKQSFETLGRALSQPAVYPEPFQSPLYHDWFLWPQSRPSPRRRPKDILGNLVIIVARSASPEWSETRAEESRLLAPEELARVELLAEEAEPVPRNIRQWKRQREIQIEIDRRVSERASRVSEAERVAVEARTACQTAFCEIVGLVSAEAKDLARLYVEELIEFNANGLFERLLRSTSVKEFVPEQLVIVVGKVLGDAKLMLAQAVLALGKQIDRIPRDPLGAGLSRSEVPTHVRIQGWIRNQLLADVERARIEHQQAAERAEAFRSMRTSSERYRSSRTRSGPRPRGR